MELVYEPVSENLIAIAFDCENLKCLNKKAQAISDMPTSRRFKKNQNQKKFQHNKPTRKNKNKLYLAIGIISVAIVVVAAFFVLNANGLFSAHPNTGSINQFPLIASGTGDPLTSPPDEYSTNGTRVLLITSVGNITIQMRDDKGITTQNFVKLVKQGFYDGTIFHRVIAGFMIQGGENQSINVPSIPDEIGNNNTNYNGTIAMANTGQPNTASSQFFINVADNQNLYSSFDTSYTVFGQVIQGMNVVMAISNMHVNPSNDQPLKNVTLIKAEILPSQ